MKDNQTLLKKVLKYKRKKSFSELKATLNIELDDDLMTEILKLLEKELKGFNFDLDPIRHRFFFTCFEYLEYAPSKLSFESEHAHHNIAKALQAMLPIIQSLIDEPVRTVWQEKYDLNKELLNKIVGHINDYNVDFNPNEEFYAQKLYDVVHRILFDVKNPYYVKGLINNMPHIKQMCDETGKPLIQELVEHYLKLIKADNNRVDLFYFEKVVNKFTTSSYDVQTLEEIKKLVLELNKEIKHNRNLSEAQSAQMLLYLAQINRNLNCDEVDDTFVNDLYYKYMVSSTFPLDIIKAVDDIEDHEEETKDYRNRHSITIDTMNCHNPEDAISIQLLPDGNYELSIYIADVDFYVKHGSKLDLEATRRAITTDNKYDTMFPKEFLSRFLALYRGLDRNVIAFSFTFDNSAKLLDYKVEQAVINVKENLNYTGVKEVIEFNDTDKTAQTLKQAYHIISSIKHIIKEEGNTCSISSNMDKKKIKNYRIGEYISSESATFLNTFIATYFAKKDLQLIYKNNEFEDHDEIISIILEQLSGTDEANRLIKVIDQTRAPLTMSPVSIGEPHAVVSNPFRMFDAYINLKKVKCHMLGKESEYTVFNDYCNQLLPFLCDSLTKRSQLLAYYKEDLNILSQDENHKQKQLTKD